MAEARLGVVPKPALQRGAGVNPSVHTTQASFSQDGFVLYIPHPKFIIRNIRRKLHRVWSRVEVAFMPIPVWSVLGVIGTASVWVAKSRRTSWQRSGWLANILWKLDSKLPFTQHMPIDFRVGYLTLTVSSGVMLAFTATQRILLRRLLSYHGWLYERGPKRSTATKLWGFMLKTIFLNRIHKKLVAYQTSLPTLPLPDLKSTVSKYLESIRPLTNDAEFAEAQKLANHFIKHEGPKLQNLLRMKWLVSSNYISDWWLNYVYLRGRESISINSNWYGIMYADFYPSKIQASRAAVVVHNLVQVKCQLEMEQFEPQIIGSMVPLCMEQYKYAFSSTRVPGREQDRIKKFDVTESRHVAVIHKGRFYKLPVFSPKTLSPLSALQLEAAIEGIINSAASADPNEQYIPSLTAAPRSDWAEIREEHFKKDRFNRDSLRCIESSIFVLCLDDEDRITKSLSEEGKDYLCGNGYNRWCDKSFNCVVSRDGKVGFHVEHAWGDAPTLAHVIENISLSDEWQRMYDDKGRVKPNHEDLDKKMKGIFCVYPAERVRFHVDSKLVKASQNIYKNYVSQVDDVDLCVKAFNNYGKRLCKKSKCSPDAWIQLAMQLAYYRDQGHLDQTYESAMTRLFKEGRTETIRSASNEALAFVKAFEGEDGDEKKSNEDLIKLLRVACDRHQQTYLDAMSGKGVDRHLFALYVVAVGRTIDSSFLNHVLSRKWKLSTSQVPTRQLSRELHHPDENKFHTPYGGFGPVADDGYGTFYCVWNEDMFYFSVSSKKSAANTDSERFHGRICQALDDMATLFNTVDSVKKKE